MNIILVITVGGSCKPVVAAVRDFAPQITCFVVSTGSRGSRQTVDGAGKPCKQFQGEDAPNIVTQLGLDAGQYRIIELDDPDSLEHCYSTILSRLDALKEEFPDAKHVADYTGGTKTMSAALAIAALDSGWQISLVKGARNDLVMVVDGTEISSFVNAQQVRARQQIAHVRRLFNNYQYLAAEQLITSVLQSGPLSGETQRQLRKWIAFVRGFDAWDRFDHARAYEILQPFQAELGVLLLPLKRLAGRDPKGASGYEPVLDLIENARRRAAQGRYDDAVARLYRAIELLAQVRLQRREPSLSAGDLDIVLLPEPIRAKYALLQESEDGPLQLGLRQDYELLQDLDDPVGEVGKTLMPRMLNALSKRNNSIMAHGSTPLQRGDWEDMLEITLQLANSSLSRLKVNMSFSQFPALGETGLEIRSHG